VTKGKVAATVYLSGAVALLTLALQGSASAIPSVPELDPQTIGAGLAVCGAAAALLLERYRRTKF
jgi:hypothetical protein